ncbi:MAG: histidine--tRNA ligase [Syntrophales bacterium]|nr:histidine--tRNA ligase [Syntrophales bacterium]MDY0044631.1 histidine--tRNA ligase [Syntrophales bacterium]
MASISSVRGFKDILPGETPRWHHVEERARKVFSSFGVNEIRIPILEKTELFKRGIGEATDIVEKEMYTFLDRGGEYLTLRPEATASVIRAYLEHHLYAEEPLSKLYTIGPMFRRERPQKGRFRQFHQINVEFLGQDDPRIDSELIFMLIHLLHTVGLTDLSLEINSLGCPECRPAFRKVLTSFLEDKANTLCEDCRRRLSANPLRIFDCKQKGCQEAITEAPCILDHICDECGRHFKEVQKNLNLLNTSFTINRKMVRGLDYYTRTAFEVTTNALGAQNAVTGGGRYDGLTKLLGGPDIPGIGFAIGVERLISLIPEEEAATLHPDVFLAALGSEARDFCYRLSNTLRLAGLKTEMDFSDKSLKSQMKRAHKLGCRFTLIIGEKEMKEKKAQLRNMEGGEQREISLASFSDLAACFKRLIQSPS